MKKNIFILLLVLIPIASLHLKAEIIAGPYLQAVTDNYAVVIVECSSKQKATLTLKGLWKADKNPYLFKSEPVYKTGAKTYVQKIFINVLTPDNKFSYKIIHGKDTSVTFTFYTPVSPGKKTTFAVMGDSRSNPKILNKISGLIIKNKPRFSIYTGDLCHDPKYSTWKKEFFVGDQLKLASEVPFYNTVGNHEGWSETTKAFTHSAGTGKENRSYYSLNRGDVLFLIINSETNIGPGSAQWKFVEKELKSTDKKWKVAVFHIPAYCAGGHGDSKNMQRMSKELFEKYSVDFVFNGHSHFYQHNLVNGIHHIILAGGGTPLYTPKKKDYVVKSVKKHHYAIADVSPKQFIINVYDIENKLIDKIVKKK